MTVVLTFVTFINVDVTFRSYVATGTATRVAPVDHAGLADGSCIARVGCASIVDVTQKSSLVRGTFANETGHTIPTCPAVEARLSGTVIHVDLAVMAFEAVDTNARVSTFGVVAGGAVLAYVGPGGAFINVLGAKASGVFGGAVAGVGADSINATASILAKMSIAVVNVDVAS